MLNTKCRAHGSDHPDFLCGLTPDPCGCVWLSECCGGGDVMMDVAADNTVGMCTKCLDHAGFERSEEDTWKYLGRTTYGDDADGRRGRLLYTFECTECFEQVDVIQ